jgi:hypothetical protein
MSQICGMSKNAVIYVEVGSQAKLTSHFSSVILSFADMGLSCRVTCSASGDDGQN